MDSYLTISASSTAVYTEKRSRFLAFAHHVESKDDAAEQIARYRKEYYDARHVCYAYVLGADRSIYRLNDDGEPSGTAGRPILGQINKRELTDVLVVVVRYFGGVKLGTSGLIAAYRTATAAALDEARVEAKSVEETIVYAFPYERMNKVMRIAKDMPATIVAQDYDGTRCVITFKVRRSLAEQFSQRLNDIR